MTATMIDDDDDEFPTDSLRKGVLKTCCLTYLIKLRRRTLCAKYYLHTQPAFSKPRWEEVVGRKLSRVAQ